MSAKDEEEDAAEDGDHALVNVLCKVAAAQHRRPRAQRVAQDAAQRDAHHVGGRGQACEGRVQEGAVARSSAAEEMGE